MERQPGRSAAVAQFGRVGCFGASQSFGLRRQASWLKVWRGDGCKFSATEQLRKIADLRLSVSRSQSKPMLQAQLEMEPMVGIEPTTDGLRNRCSTTELHWLQFVNQSTRSERPLFWES